MTKRVIIVCEGKSDFRYLQALQRFVKNDLPLPPGEEDAPLLFVPRPSDEAEENPGVGTGFFAPVMKAYMIEKECFEGEDVSIWVDADIYIRNESHRGERGNKELYLEHAGSGPVFRFSYHNFEDFLALHYDEAVFQTWKQEVLLRSVHEGEPSHHDLPLSRKDYASRFQKVFPHYSKHKFPFEFSKGSFANLRRHLQDPDVQSMEAMLQPGISFGRFLLELLDEAYPNWIP